MSGATCTSCGSELAPGAKFCRSCGQATSEPAAAGACATCGHVNPPDSSFCRSCGVKLSERSGARLDESPTIRQPVPSAPAAPQAGRPAPAAAPPPAFPPPAASPPSSGNGNTTLLIVGIVLVLVAVGVGGVMLVRGGGSHHPTVAGVTHETTTTTITEPTSAATQPKATEGASTENSSDPYSEVSAIESVLRQFHEDVLDNNFHGAWELTSPRYRRQKENEPGGYAAWAKNQKTLQRYLDPRGLRASIYSWEEKPQIATVRVTGMRWSEPGSSCSYFQGITWMHHEGSTWYYEPGYSISPQRRAQWEARKPALLGWGCA
jgi:ribosomal protein L40E